MPKFRVIITETLERVVEVTAPDEERAMEIIFDQYRDEDIVLNADDYVDTAFDIVEVEGDDLNEK